MKGVRLKIKKAVILTLVTDIIQTAALTALLLYLFLSPKSFLSQSDTGERIFIASVTVVSFAAIFFSMRDIYHIIDINLQNSMIREALSSVENLNNSLRAQRHDFLNHLQVVYGLIELDEYYEAKNYINKVYKDIQSVSRVLKTANPAVNALLQAKLMTCEENRINAEILVSSRFENIPVPSWELCRVLGNLTDNAISELCEKPDNRLLQIELKEDPGSFIAVVKDNGRGIPDSIRDRIFEPGFTTKKNGEGMGLSIARRIIHKYGGRIEVNRDNYWTVFTVFMPKQEPPDV
ncbi:MAG: GHKL domain-containing protein [Clostridiaceae bacterium]|nr:GHKL domain-containing protein [Clostridiaceae bacterium]